jgi:5-methylcytosine-specific restriction enzyme B
MSALMNKPIHKILFGSPGTGKSHRIVSEIIPNYLGIDESTHPENIIKIVFLFYYIYFTLQEILDVIKSIHI